MTESAVNVVKQSVASQHLEKSTYPEAAYNATLHIWRPR